MNLQNLYFETNPYDVNHIEQVPWKKEFVNNYLLFPFFLEMNQSIQMVSFLYHQLLFLQYDLSINKELNSSLNLVDVSQDQLLQLGTNYSIVHRNVSSSRRLQGCWWRMLGTNCIGDNFGMFHTASPIWTEDVGNINYV